MSKLFKECNFRAIRSTDARPWVLAYHETFEEAKSWVGGYAAYVIYEGDKAVSDHNWDLELDKRAESLSIDPEVHIERVNNV